LIEGPGRNCEIQKPIVSLITIGAGYGMLDIAAFAASVASLSAVAPTDVSSLHFYEVFA
jgi:hypothetical protein